MLEAFQCLVSDVPVYQCCVLAGLCTFTCTLQCHASAAVTQYAGSLLYQSSVACLCKASIASNRLAMQGSTVDELKDKLCSQEGPKVQATQPDYVKFHDDKVSACAGAI